jgi:hypothetical protein
MCISNNTSLRMAKIGSQNMKESTMFIIREIYISVYAILGRITHSALLLSDIKFQNRFLKIKTAQWHGLMFLNKLVLILIVCV